MRKILVIIALVSLFGCKREDPKLSELSYVINGTALDVVGISYLYSDRVNGNNVRYSYQIFSQDSTLLYVELFDSTFTKTNYEFKDLEATYSYTDKDGIYKSCKAVEGELHLSRTKNDVISGDFWFNFINVLDPLDTVEVLNGEFIITVERYSRDWDF